MSAFQQAFVATTPLFTKSTCVARKSCPLRKPSATYARRSLTSMKAKSDLNGSKYDVIIVGSGFGGLCAGALLTSYGYNTLLLESHYTPGGVAHGFEVKTSVGLFKFDTGPSFFCGLDTPRSLNPLKHALDALGEQVPSVSYDCFCIDDLKVGTVTVSDNEEKTLRSIRKLVGNEAVRQLREFYVAMRKIHARMDVPAIALRGDWRFVPVISRRWAKNMLSLLPYVNDVKSPVSNIMKRVGVTHPFVKRVLDTESFLLSGLKTDSTITAEIAFMVGERCKTGAMQYPIGGAAAIVNALVRGIERKGGEIRLRSHVEEIVVEDGTAVGVKLRSGDTIQGKHVFSNASLWDTIKYLLPQDSLPSAYRRKAMQTPVVESFMHVHMAIPADGLDDIIGHHAVIIDSDRDISIPGNTVMISIPTMWSAELAPEGWHIIHAYTLENYDRWPQLRKNRKEYEAAKRSAAVPLFTAVRHVIPDVDRRLAHKDAFVKLGSPITHEKFNRRYKGTYGAAIAAGQAEFEWPSDIPIRNLKRCSDSAFPGIGVPSSAAAGLIAANELVSIRDHNELIDRVFPRT